MVLKKIELQYNYMQDQEYQAIYVMIKGKGKEREGLLPKIAFKA